MGMLFLPVLGLYVPITYWLHRQFEGGVFVQSLGDDDDDHVCVPLYVGDLSGSLPIVPGDCAGHDHQREDECGQIQTFPIRRRARCSHISIRPRLVAELGGLPWLEAGWDTEAQYYRLDQTIHCTRGGRHTANHQLLSVRVRCKQPVLHLHIQKIIVVVIKKTV